MIDRNDIKRFVKKTLGCTCPDEVFQHIECQTDVSIGDDIVLDYEINVGNRLLIYVASVDETDLLRPMLSQLVRAGINKRDEHEFNRFRLVLLTATPRSVAYGTSEIFQALGTTDEKAHLHVINKDDFPDGLPASWPRRSF